MNKLPPVTLAASLGLLACTGTLAAQETGGRLELRAGVVTADSIQEPHCGEGKTYASAGMRALWGSRWTLGIGVDWMAGLPPFLGCTGDAFPGTLDGRPVLFEEPAGRALSSAVPRVGAMTGIGFTAIERPVLLLLEGGLLHGEGARTDWHPWVGGTLDVGIGRGYGVALSSSANRVRLHTEYRSVPEGEVVEVATETRWPMSFELRVRKVVFTF